MSFKECITMGRQNQGEDGSSEDKGKDSAQANCNVAASIAKQEKK